LAVAFLPTMPRIRRGDCVATRCEGRWTRSAPWPPVLRWVGVRIAVGGVGLGRLMPTRISYALARGLWCLALLVAVARCNSFLGNEPGDLVPDDAGGTGPGSGGAGADAGGADRPGCGSLDDPKNCGACGHDCTSLPNVSPGAAGIECRNGSCVVPPG